ncbi:DUF3054 domain-containing protein [Halorussus sp. MSC15.2]|uniref:DUF3054 domain-containing protein n=1 Tax=Halorussus sp. MSC15.2 TaxID=2283638 RepID=UPI0013D37B9B|nr:DUF3054 domain-containing protein [Halorussus sp. MSC15.2]NEU57336.1 DUF3054 domain-containing protein [Halorussus sp. MSC15.2]
MSNADGLLRSRVNRSPGTARLALGDLLVMVGFLVMGELRHGVNPVTMPGRVAGTIAPFLAGWVVAAFVVGTYAPGATRTVRTAVQRAAGAWVLAAAIGLALRSTEVFHGDAPWTFALVVTATGVVFFSAWRATVASLR